MLLSLLCLHILGAYVLQSRWMVGAAPVSRGAAVSALVYVLPYLWLRPSLLALLGILAWRLASTTWNLPARLGWLREWLAPKRPKPYAQCSQTGYASTTPLHVQHDQYDFLAIALAVTANWLILRFVH